MIMVLLLWQVGPLPTLRCIFQSTWNDFELRLTFWPANHESLSGHFDISPDIYVRRKRKPSPDIFNIQTDNWNAISLLDILLNLFAGHFAQFPLADKMSPSPSPLPLHRTFEIFAGHVRRDRRISRTLIFFIVGKSGKLARQQVHPFSNKLNDNYLKIESMCTFSVSAWGEYDELGHILPQEWEEGPEKVLPHMVCLRNKLCRVLAYFVSVFSPLSKWTV